MTERSNKTWEPIDFTVYFDFIKWPVIFALVLEIIFRLWAGSLSMGLLFEQMELLSWIIRLVAFFVIARRSIKNFGYSAAIVAISGALSGLAIGFIISLFRFADGINYWKFFNLITETLTVAVVGSLVAIFIVYVFSIRK